MPALRVANQPPLCRTREAKVVLERAVAVLKADKDQALDLLTSGNGGFIDRDLYVFCSGPDGMLTAHPCFTGVNLFSDVDTRLVGCGHLSGLLMRC